MKHLILAFAFALTLVPITAITTYANPPPYVFGASPQNPTIHLREQPIVSEQNIFMQNQMPSMHRNYVTNQFYEGQRIGTLYVNRLNRTILVFEGESMRNMDFGAGRFIFSGTNSGNTVLIGHNRGRINGFFDFVKLLQTGDKLTLDVDGVVRTYKVSHEVIIHENDFSPLLQFGDDRLTLVTCVEYRPRYRRIAVAKAV